MTYSRSGNKPRGVVVQVRDRRLLEELAVMRIIDREQAKIVAGFGSTTRANTRLLALTHAGLLRRFFLSANVGARKALYALSRKGAELVDVPYRERQHRNNEILIANWFVHHQLAVNQIYCALKSGDVRVAFGRWITFYEPLAPHLRIIPDGYFELNTPSGVVAAFLELDLGHEGMSIWKQKVRNYLQLALSGECERRFGQTRFRVLTIVSSDRKLAWIRKGVRASTKKIFWFTTIEAIHSHGLFAPIWFRPTGEERQSLLSQPP